MPSLNEGLLECAYRLLPEHSPLAFLLAACALFGLACFVPVRTAVARANAIGGLLLAYGVLAWLLSAVCAGTTKDSTLALVNVPSDFWSALSAIGTCTAALLAWLTVRGSNEQSKVAQEAARSSEKAALAAQDQVEMQRHLFPPLLSIECTLLPLSALPEVISPDIDPVIGKTARTHLLTISNRGGAVFNLQVHSAVLNRRTPNPGREVHKGGRPLPTLNLGPDEFLTIPLYGPPGALLERQDSWEIALAFVTASGEFQTRWWKIAATALSMGGAFASETPYRIEPLYSRLIEEIPSADAFDRWLEKKDGDPGFAAAESPYFVDFQVCIFAQGPLPKRQVSSADSPRVGRDSNGATGQGPG